MLANSQPPWQFHPRKGFEAGLNVDTLCYLAYKALSWPVFPVLMAMFALISDLRLLPLFLSLTLASLALVVYLYGFYLPTAPIDWSRQTVVLTGGSHGIGLSLLRLLATTEAAARIAVIDINELPDSAPACARLYKCDLGDSCAVETTVECIQRDLGPVTMLINNAGTVCPKLFADNSLADIQRVMAVNALAPMQLTQLVLSGMLRQEHAHLVYVSSVLAFLGVPQVASYNASKAAVAVFQESLRIELERRMDAGHVRVTGVFPSMVETGMFAGTRMPRWLSPRVVPEDVAEWIFWMLHYGRGGDLYMPLYANLAPLYMALPRAGRMFVHWLGGSIDAMRSFRGHRGREPTISM
ncbi:hypothetical protein LPJ56_000189 [Coemansia sp. RSA 2599]|nr:hypothetical protein LPJ75_000005 [Coemansia sp. RSA 2598]KAJ1829670.1 hypothetical protein LPJ56_000189 [Coemansia sp. RSA 2599]